MTMKSAAVLLAIVMVAILAAGLWSRYGQPRRVVSTATIRLTSGEGDQAITLRTRVVMVGATRFDEVEMPSGTWIDCAGDCREAARAAGPEFWQRLERNGGGR